MKTIKRLSATLLALLATLIITIPFTACGSDDDDNTPTSPKVVSHVFTYQATIQPTGKSPEFTEVADIVLHAVDKNGKETTQVVTGSEGEIKLDAKEYPCEYSFYTTLELKSGATIDPAASYYINALIVGKSTINYAQGKPTVKENKQTIVFQGLNGTKAKDYIGRHSAPMSFKFDANGNLIEK